MNIGDMVLKFFSVVVMVSVLIVASCSKNNEILNSTEVEIISSESLSEACVAEASEMSFVILSSLTDSQLGGSTTTPIPSVISSIDSLLAGASISVAGIGGMNNPQGTITISFKTTTTDYVKDYHGVTRKGIIKINYSGRRWAAGSTRSISFSGYSRNNVMIGDNTNYTITNLAADSDSLATRRNFQHVLKNCTLTFPDQKTFLRNAGFNARINFVARTTTLYATNPDSTAVVTTQYGQKFVMNITDSLVYKPQCIGAKMYLPNEGTKSITSGTSTYIVDYRSTLTCSRYVNVTAGGKSAIVTVNSDGN